MFYLNIQYLRGDRQILLCSSHTMVHAEQAEPVATAWAFITMNYVLHCNDFYSVSTAMPGLIRINVLAKTSWGWIHWTIQLSVFTEWSQCKSVLPLLCVLLCRARKSDDVWKILNKHILKVWFFCLLLKSSFLILLPLILTIFRLEHKLKHSTTMCTPSSVCIMLLKAWKKQQNAQTNWSGLSTATIHSDI